VIEASFLSHLYGDEELQNLSGVASNFLSHLYGDEDGVKSGLL